MDVWIDLACDDLWAYGLDLGVLSLICVLSLLLQRLAADFLHNYIFLAVGRVGSSTDLIVQHIEYVAPGDKRQVLLDLINTVEARTCFPYLSCIPCSCHA